MLFRPAPPWRSIAQSPNVEGERPDGESPGRELEIRRERVLHELVRDRGDERARAERHRQTDPPLTGARDRECRA